MNADYCRGSKTTSPRTKDSFIVVKMRILRGVGTSVWPELRVEGLAFDILPEPTTSPHDHGLAIGVQPEKRSLTRHQDHDPGFLVETIHRS
jgi:hypothetical protein